MSHPFICYNGKIINAANAIIAAGNRGLRYGDGLFETLRYESGTIAFASFHFERLFKGLQLLQFDCPGFFTPQYLQTQIEDLCKRNKMTRARVRLTVIRGEGGLYDAINHFPNCIIETLPLQPRMWNENGLVSGIYTTAQKNADVLANLKHNNYLLYVLAALHAKQQHWNDAIVTNNRHTICDSTIANVFIVKNKVLQTPPLTDGAVAGTIRRWVLENATSITGIKCEEVTIGADALFAADEVFFTNAIYGIRWVQSIESATYGYQYSRQLFNMLP
jgi:branched-chain amino acid aminotransferase